MRNHNAGNIQSILFHAIILLIFSMCSSNEPTSKNIFSKKTVLKNKSLVFKIAVIGDYPPFDIYKNNQAYGISNDMMKEIFKRLNISIKIEQLPFKRALAYLKKGYIDAISGLGKNSEREQYIIYPKIPLTITKIAFFVRKDSNIVYNGNLKEMAKHRIGTVLGFMYTKEFKSLVDQGILHIEESKDVKSNIQKLLLKRYNLIIANSSVTLYLAKQLKVSASIKELSPQINLGYMYLGISKQSRLLVYVTKINDTMMAIRKDGTEEQIRSKYIK